MDAFDADRAPEPLDVLRLFVNTLDFPAGPDVLEVPEAAARWCESHGLPPVAGVEEAQRLRAFREALRAALAANNEAVDPAAAWEPMRLFLDSATFSLELRSNRGPALAPAATGSDRTIAALLAIAYEALAAGTWSRLRACRKNTCRFAYYDRSKNGSRAWCSMAVCGNREKAQRRRSRERHDAHP